MSIRLLSINYACCRPKSRTVAPVLIAVVSPPSLACACQCQFLNASASRPMFSRRCCSCLGYCESLGLRRRVCWPCINTTIATFQSRHHHRDATQQWRRQIDKCSALSRSSISPRQPRRSPPTRRRLPGAAAAALVVNTADKPVTGTAAPGTTINANVEGAVVCWSACDRKNCHDHSVT